MGNYIGDDPNPNAKQKSESLYCHSTVLAMIPILILNKRVSGVATDYVKKQGLILLLTKFRSVQR